jgi:hypothetical protein
MGHLDDLHLGAMANTADREVQGCHPVMQVRSSEAGFNIREQDENRTRG